MNRKDVINLAKEAGIGVEDDSSVPVWHMSVDYLERFAALVAVHTLSNIDPSKLMSHQEGFKAGRLAERERIASQWDALHDKYMKDPLRRQMMLSYELVAQMIRGKA